MVCFKDMVILMNIYWDSMGFISIDIYIYIYYDISIWSILIYLLIYLLIYPLISIDVNRFGPVFP